MKIRVYILDDEPLARDRVRMLVRKEPDLEIVGEFDNGKDALVSIESDRPDLLFLDVQMPGMDGFGFLKNLPDGCQPAIIFTTAYEKHALKAFEAHAVDYLLKPFKPERFKVAVERVRKQLQNRHLNMDVHKVLQMLVEYRESPANIPPIASYLTRLTIRDGERVAVIRTDDIDLIESAGNYVSVTVGKESHIMRETLNTLEAQLSPERFLRISRSAIVNLNHVKELQTAANGKHVVVLRNGTRLQMTRGLKDVEQALKYS